MPGEPGSIKVDQGVAPDSTTNIPTSATAPARGVLSRAASGMLARFGGGNRDADQALAGIAGQDSAQIENHDSNNFPRVDVGDGKLGMELTEPGQTFSFYNIFDTGQIGGDAFTVAIIQTKSGNMYLVRQDPLELDGEVINAQKSREQGGRPYGVKLDGDVLARSSVTVGKPFSYGEVGTPQAGITSDVVKATFI